MYTSSERKVRDPEHSDKDSWSKTQVCRHAEAEVTNDDMSQCSNLC